MKAQKSFFSRLFGNEGNAPLYRSEILSSPLTGRVVQIEEVADQTFAGKILGDGLAVEPAEGKVYSPVDGVITSLMDTLHALCITSAGGAEILIHIGIDTVTLGGRPFISHIREGQQIKRGDLLLDFDPEAIRTVGLQLTTPVVVSNYADYDMEKNGQGDIAHGDVLMTLNPKT